MEIRNLAGRVAVFALAGSLLLVGAGLCAKTPEQTRASADAVDTTASTPRPPAVPLAVHTPFFSVWSPSDRLNERDTIHWTGKPHPLFAYIRVDGKALRVMGAHPAGVPPLPQTGLQITPTRSIYRFANETIRLRLTFMSPFLPDDLSVLARPATYVAWDVESADGKPHDVEVCLQATGHLAVNDPEQTVEWRRERIPGLTAMRIGSEEQPVLATKGDDHRIDWGYCYAASPASDATACAGPAESLALHFAEKGFLPKDDLCTMPLAARQGSPAIAVAEKLGRVSARATAFQVLAYDELYSIQYFNEDQEPYWRRGGTDAPAMLKTAASQFAALRKRCETFDSELTADLERIGGAKYAYLCALAYRQAIGGSGLSADSNGAPLFFPKENHSNGCLATVDVIYPMCPQMLLFSPTLMKAMLVPVLDYAASPAWPYSYAPHDLGTYPIASGQVYGMGNADDAGRMPVEECGNMLIMLAALAKAENSPAFSRKYWPILLKWADYLAANGFDPESQLCTDDFAGHLARNANLAIKAVLGVAAMSQLCEMAGERDAAAKYARLAREGADKWMKLGADGDHYVLAFGKPGTWSQKYNLVWDSILKLDVFPREVAQTEAAFYPGKINRYGLPLDSRESPERPGMTKSDWIMWTASLGGTREYIEKMAAPVYDFFNESPDRLPMTDWYSTVNGRKIVFTARPVVGGYFLPMLADGAVWKKWASRDKGNPRSHIWAPIPSVAEIKYKTVIPAADTEPATWRYTTTKPADDWMKPGFDDSSWKEGKSGFGTAGTPGAHVGTEWNTSDIWLRRTITIPKDARQPLRLHVHHDESGAIYLNGALATKLRAFKTGYEPILNLTKPGRMALKPGAKVTVAIHCHQTYGGQYVDMGVVTLEPPRK